MVNSRIQRTAVALLLGFCCVHIIVTWEVRDRILSGFPDYTIFYTAGNIVRDGMASRLYDADLQYQLQQGFVRATRHGRGLLPYNHPPYEALLFVPFSYLPYMTGYVIWALLNCGVFFGALILLQPYLRTLPSFHWTVWAPLPFAFFPAFASLFEGQDSILLLLLFTMTFLDLRRGRSWRAGVWLALGLFKFQVVLPFIAITVLTRRWKLLGGFALVASALGIVSIALVGWRTAMYYPVFVRRLEETTAGGAIVPMNMPNLHGLVDAIIARSRPSLASYGVVGVLSLLLVLTAARIINKYRSGLEENDLCFSVALVASVLVSYHLFWYDWTVLLLPALLSFNYLARGRDLRSLSERLLLSSCTALFLSPLYLVPLARFGHLYGLALVLLAWFWALLRELENPQIQRSPRSIEHEPETAVAEL